MNTNQIEKLEGLFKVAQLSGVEKLELEMNDQIHYFGPIHK